MRRSRRLAPARVIDLGVHVGVEAVLAAAPALFHVRRRLASTKRIFTIDLMPLKPYFHGTTRRSGAPFWPGQRLAVEAHRQQRQRVHGLVDAQAFDVGPVEHAAALAGQLLGIEQRREAPRTSRLRGGLERA